MEENRIIRRKRIIRLISKILSYTVISLLMLVAAILLFFAITEKIANKKGVNAPYGLYTIVSPSMTPTINVYDVVLIKDVDDDELEINDVITFRSENKYFGNTPITHRIVNILEENNERLFVVKGDANSAIDDEKVKEKNILGKVIMKIPKLGGIHFFLASKKGWMFAIIIPTCLVVIYDIYKLYRLISLRKRLKKLAEEDDSVLPEIKENNLSNEDLNQQVINKSIENKDIQNVQTNTTNEENKTE